jgi:hypothetical protein
MRRRLAAGLWTHTVITGLAGLLFFFLPGESAKVWPWPLPPLAARFMGSLFVGGAACSMACVRARRTEGLLVMVLLALGDTLIALSGLFAIEAVGVTPSMIFFLVFFLGIALFLAIVFLPEVGTKATPQGSPVPGSLRTFFFIHLLVVLPVGFAMFLLPDWAQLHWPWKMTPINVRFIGAFFFGAAVISVWALCQRSQEVVLPVLVLYAVFATLATVASLIHIGLFDPARLVTWAFFALYVFVAAGSWLFLWGLVRKGVWKQS